MRINKLLSRQVPLWLAIIFICAVPSVPLLLLNIIMVILVIIPRKHTRQIRRKLSKLVYWQWLQGSWMSTRLHGWLWTDANGVRDSHYRKLEDAEQSI